jgi:hypothetical protein
MHQGLAIAGPLMAHPMMSVDTIVGSSQRRSPVTSRGSTGAPRVGLFGLIGSNNLDDEGGLEPRLTGSA